MPDELSRAARPSIPPSTTDPDGAPSDRATVATGQVDQAAPERSTPVGEETEEGTEQGWVIETVVSPFHCLYQDALHFHTQSRLAQSEGEAARLARAALLLYICSAEALVRQAAVELGRPELQGLARRSQPPVASGRGLAALARDRCRARRAHAFVRPRISPLAPVCRAANARDLLGLPGPRSESSGLLPVVSEGRGVRAHGAASCAGALRRVLRTETLTFPRTGLPRDPYAFRPRHLDTARGILDAAVEALDRRMGGILCLGQRHRREPVRVVYPTPGGNGA